ncbi:hypothetical protein I79_010761 [Cricetulus griseus]|uniref:Uncharacterized protein n=1 Tax=Cricetulus griseus TaxID=10029 RepID=G3HJC0_CRIGR|nr:hypothetical protein I79_010761 [Cricetulus griseus]
MATVFLSTNLKVPFARLTSVEVRPHLLPHRSLDPLPPLFCVLGLQMCAIQLVYGVLGIEPGPVHARHTFDHGPTSRP